MSKIKIEIKELSLSQLKTNPQNPRLIKDDKFNKLIESLKTFPEMKSIREIVVDEDMIILGGNMRFKAMQELKEKTALVKIISGLSEKQKKEFIIKDNQPYGSWDMDLLANDFELDDLLNWGFEDSDFGINAEIEFPELPEGDREPFQQMTFTLADKQAEIIKNALSEVKKTDNYKYVETLGNENSNGNAIYLIVSEWAEQRKY